MENGMITNIFEDLLKYAASEILRLKKNYAEDAAVQVAIEAMLALGANEYQATCLCGKPVYVEEGQRKTCLNCGTEVRIEGGQAFAHGGATYANRFPLPVLDNSAVLA